MRVVTERDGTLCLDVEPHEREAVRYLSGLASHADELAATLARLARHLPGPAVDAVNAKLRRHHRLASCSFERLRASAVTADPLAEGAAERWEVPAPELTTATAFVLERDDDEPPPGMAA